MAQRCVEKITICKHFDWLKCHAKSEAKCILHYCRVVRALYISRTLHVFLMKNVRSACWLRLLINATTSGERSKFEVTSPCGLTENCYVTLICLSFIRLVDGVKMQPVGLGNFIVCDTRGFVVNALSTWIHMYSARVSCSFVTIMRMRVHNVSKM